MSATCSGAMPLWFSTYPLLGARSTSNLALSSLHDAASLNARCSGRSPSSFAAKKPLGKQSRRNSMRADGAPCTHEKCKGNQPSSVVAETPSGYFSIKNCRVSIGASFTEARWIGRLPSLDFVEVASGSSQRETRPHPRERSRGRPGATLSRLIRWSTVQPPGGARPTA